MIFTHDNRFSPSYCSMWWSMVREDQNRHCGLHFLFAQFLPHCCQIMPQGMAIAKARTSLSLPRTEHCRQQPDKLSLQPRQSPHPTRHIHLTAAAPAPPLPAPHPPTPFPLAAALPRSTRNPHPPPVILGFVANSHTVYKPSHCQSNPGL